MPALSQARKADRLQMADEIAVIAHKFGAQIERDDHRLDPSELFLTIKLPGASVAMGFAAAGEGPRGYGFLGHWVCDQGRLFEPGFANHSRPHHKATTLADDFGVFAALIQSGLRRVSRGSAFACSAPKEEGGEAG